MAAQQRFGTLNRVCFAARSVAAGVDARLEVGRDAAWARIAL